MFNDLYTAEAAIHDRQREVAAAHLAGRRHRHLFHWHRPSPEVTPVEPGVILDGALPLPAR